MPSDAATVTTFAAPPPPSRGALPLRLLRGLAESLRRGLMRVRPQLGMSLTDDGASQPDETQRRTLLARSVFVFAFFLLCFALLAYHVYDLQVLQHDHYVSEADERSRGMRRMYGERGRIYDFNSVLLIGNIASQSVYFEPKNLPHECLAAVVDIFVRELGADRDVLQTRIRDVLEEPIEVTLRDRLDAATAALIDSWRLPGVRVVPPETANGPTRLAILPRAISEEELEAAIDQLLPFVGTSRRDIRRLIDKALARPREIIVARDIEYPVVERMKQRLAVWSQESKQRYGKHVRVPFRTIDSTVRCHLQGGLMANLLGEVGELDVVQTREVNGQRKRVTTRRIAGLSGVERLMDEEMQPKAGKVTFLRDAKGRRLVDAAVVEKPPQNGADVYLTLQAPIQRIVEEELAKAVAIYSPETAYAIMMDPRTGAIMALAQYPSFNPNVREKPEGTDEASIKKFLRRREMHCLGECFEPGSIMKCIPVAYALDQERVNLDTQIDCEQNGRWFYAGFTLRDTHQNGTLTIAEIIERSSNIGTAKLAVEIMGNDMLDRAFRDFGFGKPVRLGYIPAVGQERFLKGETYGLLMPLKKWMKIHPSRFPIGQGIGVTPLQMIQAYGAIANGGTMMQPYIIDRIVTADGQERRSVPRVKGHPLSQHGAQLITQAMIQVVQGEHGTGKRARLDSFTVAGKTGTAEIAVNGRYLPKYFTSSFAGFVPAERPVFTLLVTLKGVNKHGGTVCGPVFKAIAERTLEHLSIQPEQPTAPNAAILDLDRDLNLQLQ